MDTKEVWRQRTKDLVQSGLKVSEWCERNSVELSGMHKHLRVFRDAEPDLFGGYAAAHAGDGMRFWYEATRKYNESIKEEPAFIEVKLSDNDDISPCMHTPLVIDLKSCCVQVKADSDISALRVLLSAMRQL